MKYTIRLLEENQTLWDLDFHIPTVPCSTPGRKGALTTDAVRDRLLTQLEGIRSWWVSLIELYLAED